MNERIKDLLKQATTTHLSGLGEWDEVDHEKFAELIVRECAGVAQMNTPDTEECEYTHLISEKIKEHFGITTYVD
jgi:hypothetical protein